MEYFKNTTQKGDQLEDQVYNFLKNKINNYEYPIFPPSATKIRQKPKYYSSKRGGDITFDLSIEVYLDSNNIKPLSIYIIECKNYNSSVPVDDIEEFSAKLNQVAEHNSKGIVITSKGFQEGALKFAKSTGLGLWLFDQKNFQYVLQRNNSYRQTTNIDAIFTTNSTGSFNESLRVFQNYFYYDGTCYANFSLFISSLFSNTPPKRDHLNHFKASSYTQIEKIADSILLKINYQHRAVDLLSICKIYKINYEFQQQNINENILGEIVFSPLKITIFDEGTHRSRFTLAHELGHLFLNHSIILQSEYVTKSTFTENDNAYNDMIIKLEREANYFASVLLLPEKHIIYDFFVALKKYKIRRPSQLYIDYQPENITMANLILQELSDNFQVSKQAILIRLKKLGLLIDARFTQANYKSLKSIIN